MFDLIDLTDVGAGHLLVLAAVFSMFIIIIWSFIKILHETHHLILQNHGLVSFGLMLRRDHLHTSRCYSTLILAILLVLLLREADFTVEMTWHGDLVLDTVWVCLYHRRCLQCDSS